jgi:preprotein translocase subunit SecE
MKNPFRSTRVFFGEMTAELKKANWPNRSELRDSTIVVLIASTILGVFTGVCDFALINVVDLFTSWVG